MFIRRLCIVSSLLLYILPIFNMEEKKKVKQPVDTIVLKQEIKGISYIGKKPKDVKSSINYGWLDLNAKDPITQSTYKESLTENRRVGLPLILCLTETKDNKGISIFRVVDGYSYLNNVLSMAFNIPIADFLSSSANMAWPNLSHFKDVISNAGLISYPLLFSVWPGDTQATYLGKLSFTLEKDSKIQEHLMIFLPYEYITTESPTIVETKLDYIIKQLDIPLIKSLDPSLEQSRERRKTIFELLRIALNIPNDFITFDAKDSIENIVTESLKIFVLEANQLQKNQIELIYSLILNNRSKIGLHDLNLTYLIQLLNTQPALRSKALQLLNEIPLTAETANYLNYLKAEILWGKEDFEQLKSMFPEITDLQKKEILQAVIAAIQDKEYTQAIEKLKAIINQNIQNIKWKEGTKLMINQKNNYFNASITLAEIYALQGNKKAAKEILEKITDKVEYLVKFPYLFYRAQKLWKELRLIA